ncbi:MULTISPECIES: Fic family protein [unclassified Facklamia]|uniref:protein adenylyltransferase Fic n=1 Tax=Aerococcaceae TaxID=186827 RepID=UPI0013B9F90D|nr:MULTISPECIES: Fic family protein [unclassified Facklamia]MBS4461568.1 Fic family protein [Aerococcaceae bacterium zg-B36]NEW63861.1 cell filamentation protein Fic [Facklamia sp. 252]NEW67332.1 cell filamentation protein Fic [Facklamia sp. 253]QQD65210.1 Fic family protein [Aerococcaceae bacterium zg-252]
MDNERQFDECSKVRALRLWDTGEFDRIEVGTFEGLRQIHEHLFYDIPGYNAGKLREVNISKDNFLFASALYLPQAVKAVEDLPQQTFEQIMDKYIEMNIVHPFIEGNGRATRLWLDQMLKQELNVCVDWQLVDKQEYLDFMRLSPTNSKYITQLLRSALTEQIHNREIFMKGIDQSYAYESSKAQDLSSLISHDEM